MTSFGVLLPVTFVCAWLRPVFYCNFVCLFQQELAAIFKKIGDKQTCSIGLYELYRITQLYPKVSSCLCYSSFRKWGCPVKQLVLMFCLRFQASLVHSSNGIFQVDIFAQLQNASEAFRTYIRDGLAQVCCRIYFKILECALSYLSVLCCRWRRMQLLEGRLLVYHYQLLLQPH